MRQMTLATYGFERYAKTTRRAAFLAEMERVVPWTELCALIEPVYPKAGNGRPPIGLERMLRIYFLQQWFNLSDLAVEEGRSTRFVARSALSERRLQGLLFFQCAALQVRATQLSSAPRAFSSCVVLTRGAQGARSVRFTK